MKGIRGKTLVKSFDSEEIALEDLPLWGFDGSSTEQAPGGASDCVLKPVAHFPDSTRINGYIVLCEVMNVDGTPAPVKHTRYDP